MSAQFLQSSKRGETRIGHCMIDNNVVSLHPCTPVLSNLGNVQVHHL